MFCNRKVDPVAPTQPSLWERFDAAERERRIDEFIAADAEKSKEWIRGLPSIAERCTVCQRCGQGNGKHRVSTAHVGSTKYEIVVHERDGEIVLSKTWYPSLPSIFIDADRTPVRVFRSEPEWWLNVTCECGNVLGSYRPLNIE